ncbi:hypothetical protein VP1G_09813 [Cytospora mali]|uniref:Pyridoxamine 5'-phosphate oxidase Alr4036 family FMN-binding domain-containing protein n=1 Tax=Cytospora mali TaxID=578113 RepID=A0A194VFN1_CYTMA|nr:hypothetical protein VP1G_09813 [Valsa mali var. pyri (nom. inval.)]
MASSTTTAAAPWRAQFLDHISKMDQPSFTFTSLHAVNNASVPRARTCVFRGLWASLPENPKNTAPRNPDIYTSDCLTLTTDARMDKVPEIFASGEATGRGISSSGGGGAVEAMFWAAKAGVQWRVRGRAWVLSPSDVEDGNSAGAKAAREALAGRMRRTDGAGAGAGAAGERGVGMDGEWSWEREIVGHFGNLSPGMRGSFKNPPPGSPRANAPGPGEGLGQKVGDELLEDEVARRNFRVVVVVPDEVDVCDLSDLADQRRWLYTFVGSETKATKPGGEVIDGWEKVEVWP